MEVKRVKKRFIIFFIVLTIFPNAVWASQLSTNAGIDLGEGPQSMFSKDTGIQFAGSSVDYQTTSDLFQLILTNALNLDIMRLGTSYLDVQRIMEKGYCVDLSDQEGLMAYVDSLHDAVRNQLSHGGRLFALPDDIYFQCYEFDPYGWKNASYEMGELPDTFPEFLDFLEDWCHHLEEGEIRNCHLIKHWDYTIYNQFSYPTLLSELLLKQHVLQTFHAGESLSFQQPELVNLLNRCLAIGKRLYDNEDPIGEYDDGSVHSSLLKQSWQVMFPADPAMILYLPLNDQQPKLIEAGMSMMAIPASSAMQAEALQYFTYVAEEEREDIFWFKAYLYKDATPVPDPGYEENRTRLQEQIVQDQAKLDAGELSDEFGYSLAQQIENNQRLLEQLSPYLISPETLAAYKSLTDRLTFPKPTAFWEDKENRSAYRDYIAQFAAGQMTADQLLSRLDQMAQMMELETQ